MTPERTAISNAINRLKALSEPCLPEDNARQLHKVADDALATVVVSEVSRKSYRLAKVREVIASAEVWQDILEGEMRDTVTQGIEDLRLAKQEYARVE